MRNLKMMVAVGLVLLIAAAVGSVAWYLLVPHTAEAQFAYAEKLDQQVRAESVSKSLEEITPALRKAVDHYERVESRFGRSPKAAEALARAALLQEEVAKADEEAIKLLDRVARDYTADDDAGKALLDLARLIRKRAEPLKTTKPEEALKQYKLALEKLDDYRRRFPNGKLADAALMEIGRIWQDGIGDPLINAIQTFQKFLEDYKLSSYVPEAMFRLALLLEIARENEHALQLYAELAEKYPRSPWADKALYNRGKLLADKMDKQEEAAQTFEKLQREYPQSPLSGQAGDAGRASRSKDAQGKSEEYGQDRYGGTLPTDTLADKPIPSQAEILKKFIAEKLDAQKYDLDVTIAPANGRLTVQGTLQLVNRGADKTEILLMLAQGMEIKSVEVDGAPAKSKLLGETWLINLPAPLKKDAAATLSFAYTGQFAEPMPELPPGLMARKAKAAATGTAPAATSPATAPATTTPSTPTTAPGTAPAKRRGRANPQLALGEFGYGLSGGAWYPITIIGDIFEAKTTFHVPAGTEVVANGERTRHDPGDATHPAEIVYDTRREIFGIYFTYGKYTVAEKTVGPVKYYTYLRAANAGKSDAYIATASDIIGFYSRKFGAFPYEKLAIVETPLPPFLGGVGPASMMILHEGMVAQNDVPSNLLAHELAHQWFGNLIPINMMDPDYSQWLSEGFATYADALYTEKTDGKEALSHHMLRYGQLYFQMSLMFPKTQQSIKTCAMNSPLYRPVVYEKGAITLHALRKIMGDEKFFALLQRWVADYHDKPTNVTEFRRLASEVQGSDLSWFFNEWFDEAVFAHWQISDVKLDGTAPCKVTLKVMQKDDLIAMPVDITFISAKNDRHVAPAVMIDKYEQTLELTVPFKPIKIVLDEEDWILKHPGNSNVWPMENPAPAK